MRDVCDGFERVARRSGSIRARSQCVRGLTKEEGEAARLYRLAAEQGNAEAQTTLARFYETGRGGLAKDEPEAARLYRLAADQGNAYAQNKLADFNWYGRGGLSKDESEALRYYRLAAGQGSADGQNNLAWFHWNGRSGVTKDEREAAVCIALRQTRVTPTGNTISVGAIGMAAVA